MTPLVIDYDRFLTMVPEPDNDAAVQAIRSIFCVRVLVFAI